MANYANLFATIAANIYTNNNGEVTAAMVKTAVDQVVASLSAGGYLFKGIATPTSPGTAQTPDEKVFYFATAPGTYNYLGGLVVNDGEVAILKYDSTWSKEVTGAATAAQVTELGQEIDDSFTNVGFTKESIEPSWNNGLITAAGVLDTSRTDYQYSTPMLFDKTFIGYTNQGLFSGAAAICKCDYDNGVISNIVVLSTGNNDGSEKTHTYTASEPTYIIFVSPTSNINIAKVEATHIPYETESEVQGKILASIIDSLNSDDTTKSLSAKKGAYLWNMLKPLIAFNENILGVEWMIGKYYYTPTDLGNSASYECANIDLSMASSLVLQFSHNQNNNVHTYIIDDEGNALKTWTGGTAVTEFVDLATDYPTAKTLLISNYITNKERYIVAIPKVTHNFLSNIDNVFNIKASWESGLYRGATEVTSSDWERTKIKLSGYEKIIFSCDVSKTSIVQAACGLLDADYNVIDTFTNEVFNKTIDLKDYESACYMVFSNRVGFPKFICGIPYTLREGVDIDPIQLNNLKPLGGKFYSYAYPAANNYLPEGYIPNLCFAQISDTHWVSNYPNPMVFASKLLNSVKLWRNDIKFLIHTGDIKAVKFTSDYSHFKDIALASQKPMLVTIGNHDVGGTSKQVSFCGTDLQVYQEMIQPLIDGWNLKTDGEGVPHPSSKCYYFTDFEDEKIRLIVLDEYESDFEIDPNDSSLLLYQRGANAYKQDQITWFGDALVTTPEGYGVIVAKHAPSGKRGNTDNPFNSYYFRGRGYESNHNFIPNIVRAFINGTDLSNNPITAVQTQNVVGEISCSTDFSQKKSNVEFIAYLSGHTHLDGISFIEDYPEQLELNIGCGGTYSTFDADCAHIAGKKSENCINVYAIDRNNGSINIVRIGTDLSFDMQKRDVLQIRYRNGQ